MIYIRNSDSSLDNHSIAVALYQEVRVHCVLIVRDRQELLKFAHINQTWGARCNKLHIHWMTNILQIYRDIFAAYKHELDWLLHVNVDSYVIVENLRYLLANYAPNLRLYLKARHAAYPFAHVGLYSSTDYVLSSGLLTSLVHSRCFDQVELCLQSIGAVGITSPELAPFEVDATLMPYTLRMEYWAWPYLHHDVYKGFHSRIAYPVVLPYVTANQLHVLDFWLYNLRAYGHQNALPELLLGSKTYVHALPSNNSLERSLYQKVRILCLVMTYPLNYAKSVKPIMETWGRQCNKLLFFTSRSPHPGDEHTIVLNVSEGYKQLWGKLKAAFRYVYAHHRHEADWFFKADDDTYAIMSNMRYMLQAYSAAAPMYFGCKFKPYVRQGYMSGGAGYVLSREALNRFVLQNSSSSQCNREDYGSEDYEMGQCLENCNVTAMDSRDSLGRHRFLPLKLEHFLIPGRVDVDNWLWYFLYYKHKEGRSCCSNYAITIHYVPSYFMYNLDFLLYKMRPYGIINVHGPVGGNTTESISP